MTPLNKGKLYYYYLMFELVPHWLIIPKTFVLLIYIQTDL